MGYKQNDEDGDGDDDDEDEDGDDDDDKNMEIRQNHPYRQTQQRPLTPFLISTNSLTLSHSINPRENHSPIHHH